GGWERGARPGAPFGGRRSPDGGPELPAPPLQSSNLLTPNPPLLLSPVLVRARGPRQAQLDGFDLHANVWVPPNNRARLEQLCRYLLRPPLAQDRLRLRTDGRVLVALKTVWRDGTLHLLFEPIDSWRSSRPSSLAPPP